MSSNRRKEATVCNACGFQCCAMDDFDRCGCDYCEVPACWPDPLEDDYVDDDDFDEDDTYALGRPGVAGPPGGP